MINLILSLIFQSLTGPLTGFAMEMILTPKPNRLNRWARVLLFCVLHFFHSLCKLLLEEIHHDTALAMVFSLTAAVSDILLIMLLYGDATWKRFLAFFCSYLALGSSELAFFLLPPAYIQNGLSLDFTQPDMMLGSFLALVISSIAVSVMVLIWRRFQSKRTPRFIWIYLLLPLCFCIPSIQFTVIAIETSGAVHWISLVSLLASGITTLLLIIFIFKQAEQEGIEQELAQIKFQSTLEQQHYQNIENRREEMSRIRRDYNALLSSVLTMLRSGRTEDARTALQELLQRVENTREYPYCGIPIVNALLSEKERRCRELGLKLKTDLLLPDDCGISQIDLCSAFSNLLDNAIRACGQLTGEEQPAITLTAGIQGDYLIIKCQNPAAKAPGIHPEGSGYGLRILGDIACRHDGNFSTEFENGTFTGCIILMKNTQ